MRHVRFGLAAIGLAVLGVVLTPRASAQKTQAAEKSNMDLVGWSDLQGRSAYQPLVHKQGDRFIAYIGHHGGTEDIPTPVNPMTGQPEPNGTSIVDVTDPANPKYLRHIPGAPETRKAMPVSHSHQLLWVSFSPPIRVTSTGLAGSATFQISCASPPKVRSM